MTGAAASVATMALAVAQAPRGGDAQKEMPAPATRKVLRPRRKFPRAATAKMSWMIRALKSTE